MGTRSCNGDFALAEQPRQGFEHSRGLRLDVLVTGQLHRHVTYEVTQGPVLKKASHLV